MLMVQQLCQRKKWCDHIGRPAKAKARAIGQRKQGHWMQSDSKERRSLWSSVAVSVRFSFKSYNKLASFPWKEPRPKQTLGNKHCCLASLTDEPSQDKQCLWKNGYECFSVYSSFAVQVSLILPLKFFISHIRSRFFKCRLYPAKLVLKPCSSAKREPGDEVDRCWWTLDRLFMQTHYSDTICLPRFIQSG